ncbi:hypothetical protein [Umezawaea tangerina]|uniref:hypothetical protein n=1 Tax=Umezawaea tangerina TaxID=84725 RepID=UPI0014734087|nr:hypothetical protein [Umezawaea tangerina]
MAAAIFRVSAADAKLLDETPQSRFLGHEPTGKLFHQLKAGHSPSNAAARPL